MAIKRPISNAGRRKSVDSNSYSHNTPRNDRRVSKEDTAQNMVEDISQNPYMTLSGLRCFSNN